MKIFKFGGASVKNASAVKNVANVIKHFATDNLVVVVSAMGKSTNALEDIVQTWQENGDASSKLEVLKAFHWTIMEELFENKTDIVYTLIQQIFTGIEERISQPFGSNFDFEYDQLVSNGELLSATIINAYLNDSGLNSEWFNARQLIRTNENYREGIVDWETTERNITEKITSYFATNSNQKIAITQGFIGESPTGVTTTLGREGSDYTAAIIAYGLNAESVTIWKDVPGVLNADPKWFDVTEKLKNISYKEAIELSYYGASVIHPKTIKPLQNKGINLIVRSFINFEEEGTIINNTTEHDGLIPSFIFKMNQVLISISPKDFSFIIEENLSHIFQLFAKHNVKINLMQNSAINFSVCVDAEERKTPLLITALQEEYHVKYNEKLELVTIRHYDQQTIDRVVESKTILVEQKSRFTARIVMRD